MGTDPLIYALPVMLLLIALEQLILSARKAGSHWKDTTANFAMGLGHGAIGVAFVGFHTFSFLFLYR